MKNYFTKLKFISNEELSDTEMLEKLEKTDKLTIFYHEGEKIPVPFYNVLLQCKLKPEFIELPEETVDDYDKVFLLRLGMLMANLTGNLIFICNENDVSFLSDFSFPSNNGKLNVSVCDTIKAALKIADKTISPTRKTRTPKQPKEIKNLAQGENQEKDQDVKITKLVYDFNIIVSNCNDGSVDMDRYSGPILLSLQESTDVIGLEIQLCVNIGKDIGMLIYDLIKKDYTVLKNIAIQIPLDIDEAYEDKNDEE